MHCPKCGQQQISEETRFCSRCGYLLTGTAELMLHGGLIPSREGSKALRKQSPRTKGLKQGLFGLLSAVVIVPLLTIIAIGLRMNSPILPLMALFIIVGGSCLRMAYAALFESSEPEGSTAGPLAFAPTRSVAALPEQRSIPVDNYAPPGTGKWRDTSELDTPGSVTDSTTKLLERETGQ